MTMMEVMESIFGTYSLVDGCTNWQYVGGVAVFCIVLWSVFRIIGLAVSNR